MTQSIKSHSPRDWITNDCKNGTVLVSLENLNYTLYCDYDLRGRDFGSIETETLQACVDSCTEHKPACWGVAWSPLSRLCWRKDNTVSISDLKASDGPWTSALVIPKQYAQQRTSFVCPYPNLSTQKTESGMDFQVYCGGAYISREPLAKVHVQSLEECMQRCASSHPLCTRLTFVVDLIGIGWLNCVLLSANPDEQLVPFTRTMAHSAEAVKLQLPEKPDWKNGSIQIADSGASFRVSSEDLRDVNTTQSPPITVYHKDSIQDCLAQCSKPKIKCVSLLFDSGLQSGYLNCYLFDRLPPPLDRHSDSTFLYLESLSNQYQPPPPNRTTHLSGGTIAGIVLGSLSFVAVMGFLWRQARKRNSKLKSG